MSEAPKSKKIVATAGLVLAAIFVSLLIGEILLRVFLDPIDYLRPETFQHEVLGHSIVPGSAGHDEWGYRNLAVPERADIVAIGDSQTYGATARARDSWPAILGQLTGLSVYNLSTGSRGAAEYFYVLEEEALRLAPQRVLIGLYYGNDLFDATRSAYTRDHWASWRSTEPPFALAALTPPAMPDERRFMSIRGWLGRHSMIYRLAVHSFLGAPTRRWEAQTQTGRGGDLAVLDLPERDIFTVFTPQYRLRALDLDDGVIGEGLDLTFRFLARMKEVADDNDIELLVVLIPTKERVYWPLMQDQPLRDMEAMQQLIRNEEEVDEAVKRRLNALEIGYVDVLDALRTASQRETIYPRNQDGHPRAEGYGVIAEEIQSALEQ